MSHIEFSTLMRQGSFKFFLPLTEEGRCDIGNQPSVLLGAVIPHHPELLYFCGGTHRATFVLLGDQNNEETVDKTSAMQDISQRNREWVVLGQSFQGFVAQSVCQTRGSQR